MSAFHFLNGINQSTPNAAGGAQNQGFYALLASVNQSEFSTGDAARNIFPYAGDGRSAATARLGPARCNVKCFNILIYPFCYAANCKT
jgi:hypothetical protein